MGNCRRRKMTIDDEFKMAQRVIQEADAILITAGAGMGVDSGLPDFRGNEGFWRAYPIIKDLGYSFSQMANPEWFVRDPKLAWAFYGHRLNLYRETTPHEGFTLLLDLVAQKKQNYFIFTSNVDGQFQKAGFDKDKIWEVHGSIHYFQCTQDCNDDIWNAQDEKVDVDMKNFQARNIPLCPNCNEVARPNILMFGDWSWNERRSNTQEQRYQKWIKQIERLNQKLAIIEMGAGTAIPTVRMVGDNLSKHLPNASLIRINPRESEVALAKNISLDCGALDGLKKIF